MDIFVTIHHFELKFVAFNPNIYLEELVSQNFDLGNSFHFMSKNA